MTARVLLRPARLADTAGIARCVADAYRHYIPRMGKPPGPMLDDYDEVIRRHRVFVAELQSEIAGVLVLIAREDGLLLDNVAVAPAQQGRGIGRRLLQHAEAEARRLGHSRIVLYTHECMTENIAMYLRAGYAETERKTERGYRRVYMQKMLP